MKREYFIGDFLKRIKRPVSLVDDHEYKLVTIKMNHKGVVLRELKKGALIKSNMYEVKEGDFILSGIDARNGAFGIVPRELDGAIVTNDFWYFEIDENIISKKLFLELTATTWFDEICKRGSDGTTQRIRLQKDKFFNQKVTLPKGHEQEELLEKILTFKVGQVDLETEILHQKSLLTQLKQSVLQEAIQGQLTAEWRKQNPGIEPASTLLERIKAEKAHLINDGKIKKEKPLPAITKEEIPFGLPEGWVWCRLGEITNYGSSKKVESNELKEDTWVLDLEDIEKESSRIIQRKTFKERPSLSTKSKFKKGWILYSKLRPYLNKVVVVDQDGVCTTEILPLPVYGEMAPKFIMFGMKGKNFLAYVNSKVSGMKMPRLRTEDGRLALIPVAPLEEQRAIVQKVEALMEKCLALEAEITQSEQHAQMLMQAVLKEAFTSGEARVKEGTDEVEVLSLAEEAE